MAARRLPSLTALRAFETAARMGSFKLAAADLNVTPGAISQHIRALEQHLGVALFRRDGRHMSLTPDGQALLPDLSESFARMQKAVDRIGTGATPRLTINSSAPLISKFLLPRLPRFSMLHPEIEISIETEYSLVVLDEDGPDVVIRLTRAPPEHVHVVRLFDELLLPVASPTLIASKGLMHSSDIVRARLLNDTSVTVSPGAPGWTDWFNAAGLEMPQMGDFTRFDRRGADYIVDMAIAGSGVMLGGSSMCQAAIAAGLLACPFGPVLRTDISLYLLCRHDLKSEPHVHAFFEWMKGEAALVSTLNALHEPV